MLSNFSVKGKIYKIYLFKKVFFLVFENWGCGRYGIRGGLVRIVELRDGRRDWIRTSIFLFVFRRGCFWFLGFRGWKFILELYSILIVFD